MMDLRAIAVAIGVTYRTMRNYHTNAKKHRRLAAEHGDLSYIRPGDLPPPDRIDGRVPKWSQVTIMQWRDSRPGQGVGGGRPRKVAAG